MTDDTLQYDPKKQGFTPRELIFKYVRYLPWLIISVALMLVLAYLKLRYSTPVYSVSGKILVKKNSNPYGGGSNGKYDDIFTIQGTSSSNLNDEIEVIRSRYMAARVVKALGLQTQFYNKGKIKTPAVIHPADLPFVFEVMDRKDSLEAFSLLINIFNKTQYYLNESKKPYELGQWVELPIGKIRITLNPNRSLSIFASNEFIINYQALESAAAALSSSISVGQSGEINSNVLVVSYQSENIPMGLDIVNQFMEEYQKSTLEDKRQIQENTLAFIDVQMKGVKTDLSTVERNLQGFKEQQRVFSPQAQSELYISSLSESSKELSTQEVKLRVIDLLTRYLADERNPYRQVSSTLGVEEPTLLQQVTEYNKLQLERETALKSTTAENPLIKNIEAGIARLRLDMLQNLRNIRAGYQLSIDNIRAKTKDIDNQVMSIPGKEKQLLEKTREQKILEELYSFLLQKRLETSIASASTISNLKVLEPAMAGGIPVAPNRKSTYFLFSMIGLLLPTGIIFLIELLNDKVKTKADVSRLTGTPVLGEVGHADEGGALVVTANNRQFIAEQFRILRSNLQYIIPKKEKLVMMVTSSFSGEGKSFVSTNLGAVLAISGKRTVILEFDIRKPKIMEGLGLKERKGITNYIVGTVSIGEIVYPVPGVDNLFVIPCGPVPPNPAEMLLEDKVNTLFAELRKMFDTVIVDTAPVGLVSDSITLGQQADATIYIVRHNYTFKKQVNMIDEIYKNKKLPHMSIVINDVNAGGSGYGGYYGYGTYGNYGYGYGYGYFDHQTTGRKKKSLFAKIKSWIFR